MSNNINCIFIAKLPVAIERMFLVRMFVVFSEFLASSIPTFKVSTPSHFVLLRKKKNRWPAGWNWSCMAQLHGRIHPEHRLPGLVMEDYHIFQWSMMEKKGKQVVSSPGRLSGLISLRTRLREIKSVNDAICMFSLTCLLQTLSPWPLELQCYHWHQRKQVPAVRHWGLISEEGSSSWQDSDQPPQESAGQASSYLGRLRLPTTGRWLWLV